MGLRLIRQKSETPNILSTDDARMVRYAYGGYDGVIKNRGTECGYEASGNTFKITSGVIVLQGWEVEIDGNGWQITVDSMTKYYAVYLEVNLSTDTAEIKSIYDTTGIPTVDSGDDLTRITNGIARTVLYTFKTSNSIISNTEKIVKTLEYASSSISNNFTEENGILCYNGIIIPQKKLIWSGEVIQDLHSDSLTTITLSEKLKANDKIEIEYYLDFMGNPIPSYVKRITGYVNYVEEYDVGQDFSEISSAVSVYEDKFYASHNEITITEKGYKINFGKERYVNITKLSSGGASATFSSTTGKRYITKIYKIIE